MFEHNFNPEFHWQMDQKKTLRKRVLFILLILVLLLSLFFIFKRYYFVSGRSIALKQLVPEDIKAILAIDASDIIKNDQGFLALEMGLRDFLKNDEHLNSFVNNIGKNVYWLEQSTNSQALLFKIEDIKLVQENFNSIMEGSEKIEFKNKIIYQKNVKNVSNPLIPISNNKVYLTYVNDYIFCLSNDLDFIKDILNKYQEASKIDYFGAIKDEFSDYFQEQTTLMLRVVDYDHIEESVSWIKNLSFLTAGDQNNSFVLKFKLGLRRAELLFNDSADPYQRVDLKKINGDLFHDAILHYSNFNINYNDQLHLSQNIDQFLQNNLEGLYNTNLKSKLFSNSPYHILFYPDNKFLGLSKDSEKMKAVYRNILAHLSPQTRIMILPDGSSATEYYADASRVELQEQEENGLIQYYTNLSEDTDFYLFQSNDWYILTNFKEKLGELTENQDKFCQLINCDISDSFQEVLTLNIDKLGSEEYLPWLNLFSKSYHQLNFTNFTENGENKVFLELIH